MSTVRSSGNLNFWYYVHKRTWHKTKPNYMSVYPHTWMYMQFQSLLMMPTADPGEKGSNALRKPDSGLMVYREGALQKGLGLHPELMGNTERGKMGRGQGPGPGPPAVPHTLTGSILVAGFTITNGNYFPWSGATLRSSHVTAGRGRTQWDLALKSFLPSYTSQHFEVAERSIFQKVHNADFVFLQVFTLSFLL